MGGQRGVYKAVISRMRYKQLARLKDLLSASGKMPDNGGFNVSRLAA